jgi:hypothetical protein
LSPAFKESEPEDTEAPPRHPPLPERPPATSVLDDSGEIPPFCQNCGKKIPPAANFCPGCGTKLGAHKAVSHGQSPESSHEKKPAHHEAPLREKKGGLQKEEIDENEMDGEIPVPTKPPVKKIPKGSEMTILHKFLRR